MVSKFNNLYYSGLVSDDSLNSTAHFNGTMNSYWSNCKTMSRYITGNTDIVCQKTATWTGIRKYKIGTNRVFRRLYNVDFLLIIAGRIFLNYRLQYIIFIFKEKYTLYIFIKIILWNRTNALQMKILTKYRLMMVCWYSSFLIYQRVRWEYHLKRTINR